jgi:hypothetical protein
MDWLFWSLILVWLGSMLLFDYRRHVQKQWFQRGYESGWVAGWAHRDEEG